MFRLRIFFVALVCFSSHYARADYAWLPPYRKLVLRAGAELVKSSDNFDNTGNLAAVTISGTKLDVQDIVPYLFGEYGVAENWSLWTRLQYVNSSATSIQDGTTYASGSGLGDTWVGVKMVLVPGTSRIVGETFAKFPTGRATGADAQDLVQGEGNVDLGLKVHFGVRQGRAFFSLSPAMLFRFGGYADAVGVEGAVQIGDSGLYARGFVEGMASLSAQALAPSTVNNQTLSGSANSYLKLAASPSYLAAGLKAGVNMTKSLGLEAYASFDFLGSRAPVFAKFGANLIIVLDFFEPDYRPKLHEVPFDSEKAKPEVSSQPLD